MKIGEANALACEPVEMRRGHLALIIITSYVTVPKIVDKNQKDVRLIGGKCRNAN